MRFIKQFGQLRPDKPRTSNLREFWLPFGSTLIALVAVIAQMFSNYQNKQLQLYQTEQATKLKENELVNERSLKQYELSFKPKQEAFSTFMKAAEERCGNYGSEKSEEYARKLRIAFYALEPYLNKPMREEFKRHVAVMVDVIPKGWVDPGPAQCYDTLWQKIHDKLTEALFIDSLP